MPAPICYSPLHAHLSHSCPTAPGMSSSELRGSVWERVFEDTKQNRWQAASAGVSLRPLSLLLPRSQLFNGSCFCSVAKSCPTLGDPMDYSMPSFPVLHYLPEFAQTHIHWVGDAIQPCHPLSSPSSAAFNLSQHQGLFQWVNSSHQVAKVLEFQLQHWSFQWIFRIDFL